MHKAEFEGLFDEVVSRPLANRGFVRRGKSFFLSECDRQVAWIRGAGRLTVPGNIAHIACFRHSFLRDMNETVPKEAPGAPEHYPWVLNAEQLPTTAALDWSFDPSQLMNLPYGRYEFASAEQAVVRADLSARRDSFLRYVDWATGLLLDEAVAQIRPWADEYWVARLWLADYQNRGNQGS